MQFAPSICQQCSIGCNISPGERYGELRRIENRYNGTVNHYFLCDRGRFGYGYVNLKDRPRQPVQRRGDDFITLNAEQAMQGAADILRQSKKVIGIGSPRASIESNFALRELVGAENFYTGIARGEQERLQLALKVLREGGIYTPALREIESYDAVLVLGEDVTQTARALRWRYAAVKGKAREMAAAQKVADWQIAAILNIGQRAKHPLFVTNVDDTRLDDIAARPIGRRWKIRRARALRLPMRWTIQRLRLTVSTATYKTKLMSLCRRWPARKTADYLRH